MNVIQELIDHANESAESLREGACVRGEYRPDPDTAAEVERLTRLVTLATHAMSALGLE